MIHPDTLDSLKTFIKNDGGTAVWAKNLGIAASTLYAKLNGHRPIFPAEAVKIEKLSKRTFTREELIFGKKAVSKAA